MDNENSSSPNRVEMEVTALNGNPIFIHLHTGFDDWREAAGKGPLHWLVNNKHFARNGDDASYGPRVKMINYFLAAGASVNLTDNEHCTALFEAAETGFYGGVELFLASGAEVNHQSHSGKTPLHGRVDKLVNYFLIYENCVCS